MGDVGGLVWGMSPNKNYHKSTNARSYVSEAHASVVAQAVFFIAIVVRHDNCICGNTRALQLWRHAYLKHTGQALRLGSSVQSFQPPSQKVFTKSVCAKERLHYDGHTSRNWETKLSLLSKFLGLFWGFPQLQELAHQQGGQNQRSGSPFFSFNKYKSESELDVAHKRNACERMDVHEDFKNMESSRPNCLRCAAYFAKLATNVSSLSNFSLDASSAYVALSCSNSFSLNCPLSHFAAVLPISRKCCEVGDKHSKFPGNIPFCMLCVWMETHCVSSIKLKVQMEL